VKYIAAAVMVALAAAMAACGKQQQPKVELAKPLDTAKALEQDINKKAGERGAAADQLAK
jgi:hypothetical protein